MRNKWRSGFHFGHGGGGSAARRLPWFQKNSGRNDAAAAPNNSNIYITHSHRPPPQGNFGVSAMPGMDHYMEVRIMGAPRGQIKCLKMEKSKCRLTCSILHLFLKR